MLRCLRLCSICVQGSPAKLCTTQRILLHADVAASLLNEAGQPAAASAKIKYQTKVVSLRNGTAKLPSFTAPKSLGPEPGPHEFTVEDDNTRLFSFGLQLRVLAERPRKWHVSVTAPNFDGDVALEVPARLPLQLGRVDQHGNCVTAELGQAQWPNIVVKAQADDVRMAAAAGSDEALPNVADDATGYATLEPDQYKAFCR